MRFFGWPSRLKTVPPLFSSHPHIEIRLEDISYYYEQAALFQHLSLTFPAQKFSLILGTSGSGKTTLLNLIAGLISPTEGIISASDNLSLTGRVAYMRQQDMLLPWANALDNIVIGSQLRGHTPDYDKAKILLEQVGLSDISYKKPSALSGGMRQRIALARTLYEDRPIILMDEPFSALDTINRTVLQSLALTLLRNKTVIMITHDPMEACRMGEYILVMTERGGFLPSFTPVSPVPRQVGDKSFHTLHTRLTTMLEEAVRA